MRLLRGVVGDIGRDLQRHIAVHVLGVLPLRPEQGRRLGQVLQRHGAGAFTADWAALLTAIKEKAAKLTQHARGKMDEGSS